MDYSRLNPPLLYFKEVNKDLMFTYSMCLTYLRGNCVSNTQQEQPKKLN